MSRRLFQSIKIIFTFLNMMWHFNRYVNYSSVESTTSPMSWARLSTYHNKLLQINAGRRDAEARADVVSSSAKWTRVGSTQSVCHDSRPGGFGCPPPTAPGESQSMLDDEQGHGHGDGEDGDEHVSGSKTKTWYSRKIF